MVAFVPAAVPVTGGGSLPSARAFVARRPLGLSPVRRAVRTLVATASTEPTKNTSVAGRGGKTDSDATTDDPAPLNAAAPLTDSKFYQKFNSYRGKKVPTVTETMTKFNELFPRPVPSVYRNIISEILMTTHLAKNCAMWKYDAIFAYGYDETFSEFLKFYPIEAERTMLYNAVAKSLGFSPEDLAKDAAAVRSWAEGKSEADIFAASKAGAEGASEPAVAALQYVANAEPFDYYYSRLHGIGVIKLMATAGVELTPENAGRWADELSMPRAKLTTELGTYEAAVERLKAAEQLYAEISARDARKTAERLERRAQQAAEDAAKAEKGL
ncbi:hypothetical protein I4F81_004454 [Pyropia yezoensis]|uniref:Uncharacterized protein n=1 Tax=Pyropia yezoensis TaxID=2788 RepID=A0ACC3BVW0_PYRYE|nr:hypothetical protein I4F81_004454 [Neopyropia yezoensis]